MSRKVKPKKQFYHQYVGRKIYRRNLLSVFSILFMSGIVIHDSFVHDLPFHYILFALLGAFAGKVYYLINRVDFNKSEKIIELKFGMPAIVMMISIIFIRYFGGRWFLQSLKVVWYSDAIYLFFIGMYVERVLIIMKQIDDLVYDYLIKLKEKSGKE